VLYNFKFFFKAAARNREIFSKQIALIYCIISSADHRTLMFFNTEAGVLGSSFTRGMVPRFYCVGRGFLTGREKR
jgi:hypothetical protein